MEFTWDDQKNRANQQKHGISVETAILVAHTLDLGLDQDEGEERIRILSARKATRRERRIYAQGI